MKNKLIFEQVSKDIVDLIKKLKNLPEIPHASGRENALVITKLEEANLWLSVVINKIEDINKGD